MVRVASPTAAPRLRVYLFGHFRIEAESEPIQLPTRKVAMLLAYLALHPTSHPRDKLAALCWGDTPDAQARHSLRTALTTLRRYLDSSLFLADRQTVQLNPEASCWVDVRAFQTQATQCLSGLMSDPSDVDIDLYQGDLLADWYDDWIIPEREYYRQLYLDTLLRLAQQRRAHGDYERASEVAQRVLVCDPTNEQAHQHLMFCYLMTGQRQAALAQYARCQRILETELDVEPLPETQALYTWIKQTLAPSSSPAARFSNLPIPLTSFIGRQRALAELITLLATARLLTLTGAGGCGKTRLAIQLATDVIDRFSDGVWWVELGALADAALVPQALAKTLGVREAPGQSLTEVLAHELRSKRLLLALDNCEHLVSACAHLAETLLRACPTLQMIATSREALGIAGERAWVVPSLSMPKRGSDVQPITMPVSRSGETDETHRQADVSHMTEYEAIRLFVDRARAVRPDFALTEYNAPVVTQVCQRLDGIPLAIELAAARAKILSVEQIAARVDDRFGLLTAGSRTALPRHRTLRATVDWSYDLLSEKEQAVLRRVSVFAGGFTLVAVETICSENDLEQPDALEVLSHLVDKSLVLVEAEYRGQDARYRLLETLRAYGLERLVECGEVAGIQRRHADFFLALAEQAAPKLHGSEQTLWLDHLEREHENLRAALRWYTSSGAATAGLRLGASLQWFWFMRGYFSEGRQRLAELLALAPAQAPTPGRARVLNAAGWLAQAQGDYTAAHSLAQQSLTLFRESGDQEGIAWALNTLGFAIVRQGDPASAHPLLEESLTMFQAIGNRQGAAFPLSLLGMFAVEQHDHRRAQTLLTESLAICREVVDQQGTIRALILLGYLALDLGDHNAARSAFVESLALSGELRHPYVIAYSLEGLADLAVAEAYPERAIRLAGAAAALRAASGAEAAASLQARHTRSLERARQMLGKQARASAWAAGQALTLEQAIAGAVSMQ
jgi:non-specific serine/threonine protein kinase